MSSTTVGEKSTELRTVRRFNDDSFHESATDLIKLIKIAFVHQTGSENKEAAQMY